MIFENGASGASTPPGKLKSGCCKTALGAGTEEVCSAEPQTTAPNQPDQTTAPVYIDEATGQEEHRKPHSPRGPPDALQIPFHNLPDEAIIRRPVVEMLTGLKRAAIYSLAQRGLFPRPVPLPGGRAVGWRVGDIRAVLADPAGWRADAEQNTA